ncbi:DUF4157 domain-containing protein [Desulfobacter curvatus]|uniref:eCIS core domain-containing protein n=1 Tax=Desulfobacter curvatus TaxID=2290 RepID=UPI00036CA11D|nr:DUF4157 domain-containing protein [Desulfobacter curvatus]
MSKSFIPRAKARENRSVTPRSKGKMIARIPDNRPISAAQRKIIRAVQMKFTEPEPVQGKGIAQRTALEDEELVQGKWAVQRAPEDEEELQGKFKSSPLPVQKKENQTGLPDHVKDRVESSFNTDFSDVRVHADSGKATQVGALAYTQGSDIHFAPGQFSPDSGSGRQLLGHELAHVVQQRQGRVRPTTEVNGMPVNDSASLEREADIQGRKV